MAKIWRNERRKLLKNPSIERDTSNLPCDIIQNILSRLPVKSLLRFKSVSKPWYSIISSTGFAKLHLCRSKNSDSETPFLCKQGLTSQTFYLLNVTNLSFELEAVLEITVQKYRKSNGLCSCDGLVLLKNHSKSDKMFVLWNPSTRIYTSFSCPYPNSNFLSICGLCYDPVNDDYKVVLFSNDYCYAVYSYKNNYWTGLRKLSIEGVQEYPGLFVNGALHFVVFQLCNETLIDVKSRYKCDYDYIHEIFYFNPRDDKFQKLPKPESLDDNSVFHLTSLQDKLCLYLTTYDLTSIEIWMMKEHGDQKSWTKFLTIENVPVPHKCYYVKPLYLTKESNLVIDINCSGFVVYNPMKKKFGDIHVYFAGPNLNQGKVMNSSPLFCLDSLFFPSRINRFKRKRSGYPKDEILEDA